MLPAVRGQKSLHMQRSPTRSRTHATSAVITVMNLKVYHVDFVVGTTEPYIRQI